MTKQPAGAGFAAIYKAEVVAHDAARLPLDQLDRWAGDNEIRQACASLRKADAAPGEYGSKHEAGYADPGYQSDGKPRYPLKIKGAYCPTRTRAAWNYINRPDNARQYTPAQLHAIKSRIITAWKSAVDKAGPPSAQEIAAKVDSR